MSLLRKLFGPSQDEVWSQLSQDIGAEFHKGRFLKDRRVVLRHRQWEITLDTYTVYDSDSYTTYTRMRAPYVNPDRFRFTIYRKNFLSRVGRLLGVQDIEIGEASFDDEFIIQGSSEPLVQRLFGNATLRALIQSQPRMLLQVKDDDGWLRPTFPPGVDQLYFQAYGVIKDRQRLKGLFDLFCLVLDELCRLGAANEKEPGVRL